MGEPAEWKPSDCAVKFVKFWVRRHMGQSYTDEDRQDAEQELLIHLWSKSSSYTPGRGDVNAFEKSLIKNKFASLIEHRRAKKRGGGERCLSLNDRIGREGNQPAERGDLRDQDSALRRLGRVRRHFIEEADLRMAINKALDSLAPDAREFAGQLLELTLTELSRTTGIARGTLFDRILKLRKPFSEAGVEEFLPQRRRASDEPGT